MDLSYSCSHNVASNRERSSRPRELPPRPLTEPYVNLSIHTALLVQRIKYQTSVSKFKFCLTYLAPPKKEGYFFTLVGQKNQTGRAIAFARCPLQTLHYYYTTVRPCALHRYSHLTG